MESEQMMNVKSAMKSFLGNSWGLLLTLLVLSLVGLAIFRVVFVNFVDNYEMAYKFDARTGQTTILTTTDPVTNQQVYDHGYFVTWPFVVKIHTVDMRPMQVCINANARVLNCKLVQFNPAGIGTFLSWHGRDNYDGPGNASSNSSGDSSGTTSFSEILKSYAYDGIGRSYPFMTVLRELKPEESTASTSLPEVKQ